MISHVMNTFVDLLHKYKSGLGCSAHPPDPYLFHAPSRGGLPAGLTGVSGFQAHPHPENPSQAAACAFSSGKRKLADFEARA